MIIMMEQENTEIYNVGVKARQRKEKMVEYLGQMLEPVTSGFPHINLDMAFTNLSVWDLPVVENMCEIIVYCHVRNLRKSEYMMRGKLSAFLNSRRSKGAKSMDMFTNITTKNIQQQTFEDNSAPKKGFSFLGNKRPQQ